MRFMVVGRVSHNGNVFKPGEILEINANSEAEKSDMTILVAMGRVTLIENDPGPDSTAKKRGTV